MNEIKAGPKLDRAVAEALGRTVLSHEQAAKKCDEWYEQFLSGHYLPRGPAFKDWLSCEWYLDGEPSIVGLESLPSYSHDLNVAFDAAEKVELFEGRWLGTLVSGWTVMEWQTHNIIGPARGCSTPALAICAAILELKEKEHAIT